jgi:hypothetical protein
MGIVLPAESRIEQRQRILQAVERLSASQVLHGSETLCRLLRFLVAQAWDHQGQPIKEHEIATQLLGRGDDFDSRVDPVVRVQIGRLRSKLVEYYATEGASDEVLIEIQKGSYAPTYTFRQQARPAAAREEISRPQAVPLAPEEAFAPATAGRPRWSRFTIPVLCLGVGLLLGLILTRGSSWRWSGDQADASLRSFWQPFLNVDDPPLVVFSNALFVGRPETGLHYFDAEKDDRADLLDHYTGIGEVFAVNSLDHLFTQMNSRFTLKRGQLLTWDEAKTRSMVFVGSTMENLSLRDIPWQQKYQFVTREHGPIRELYIVNLRPAPGEPLEYSSGLDRPLKKDYALISRMPAPDGVHAILILAGITTLGTQAAVEFVCDPAHVREIQGRLAAQRNSPFCAVLEIEVKGGVPFSSKLEAVSPLQRGKVQPR